MTFEGTRYCSNQEAGCSGTPMTKRNERGVTVDECPRCRGIFLDAGELAMIIATVSSQPGYTPRQPAHFQQRRAHGYGHGGGHHHRSSSDGLFGGFFGSS